MGKITRKTRLVLIGVGILLGYLFLSLGDRTAGSDGTSKPVTRIRVEDRRGFTRIVFAGHPSKESSVEPDLDKHRFTVRFPGAPSEITPPRLAKDHHLIKGFEILPDSAKGVLVQVVLTDGPVDWVCYRYESPARTVLYLRARSGSAPSRASPSSLPVSQKTERAKLKRPESPRKAQPNPSAQVEESVDLAKSPKVKRDEKGVEDLWRPSAQDIPEFIRLGSVYPPDFHEMKENERRLYQQALESFRNRDFSRAKERASKIVPEDPLSPVAETLAFFRADCDFRRAEQEGPKRYIRAIRTYRETIARFPESEFVADALLMIATGYRRIGFFAEAVVQYQLFLTKFPERPAASEALFWHGECLFQSGKYGEAKKIFGEFVKKLPRSIHARIAALRVGDCFYKMGDLKRAHGQYGRVLSESSDFSYYPLDSLVLAGRVFLENKDFRKGREILFRALNLDPDSKKAIGIMDSVVRSYREENRDEEALRVNLLLCESFDRDDPNGTGLVRLADMRLSRPGLRWPPLFVEAYLDPVGVYQDFLDHCQDMNLADEVMYRQSLALVKRGALDQAVTRLKTILSRRHQDRLRESSSSLLAYCLNLLIQRHHGLSEHLEVIRLYKDNADFLLNKENKDKRGLLLVAEGFQDMGLLEDALTVYRHVRAAGSIAQDHVLFQIGRVLSEKGEKKAARKALESFQKAFPRSHYLPEVQRLLGDLCLGMGDYRAAMKWYRLTLASGRGGPGMGRVHAHLGQALKARGRYEKAMEAYQRAVERMWPLREQAWAKELLGESLAELAAYCDDRGRMTRAVEYYQRIVRLAPSEDRVNWALYRLGESYRKAGNVEMMRRAFEDLDKKSSDSLWAKLAKRAAGDAAFEARVEPHLAQVRRTLMEIKKK